MSGAKSRSVERPSLCFGVKNFFVTTPPLCTDGSFEEVRECDIPRSFLVASFGKLQSIHHPNLCPYIDLVLESHGKVLSLVRWLFFSSVLVRSCFFGLRALLGDNANDLHQFRP